MAWGCAESSAQSVSWGIFVLAPSEAGPRRLQPEPRLAGPLSELGCRHDRLRARERWLRRRSRARRRDDARRQAHEVAGAGELIRTSRSQGRTVWTNEFSRLEVDGVDVTGGLSPAWSPSGQRLAFLRGDGLWVREMQSGEERRLADVAIFSPFTQAHVTTPSWSPDGREIAFVGPGLKISVARTDGSGVRKLTSGLDRQVSPAWSPDGSRIAFASDRGDSFDIWSIRPDGTATQRLTDRPVDETLPVWAPDGARIAFVRETGTAFAEALLWVMGGEGGFERPIGDDAHAFSQPAWSPGRHAHRVRVGPRVPALGPLHPERRDRGPDERISNPVPLCRHRSRRQAERERRSSTSSWVCVATMCCAGSGGRDTLTGGQWARSAGGWRGRRHDRGAGWHARRRLRRSWEGLRTRRPRAR